MFLGLRAFVHRHRVLLSLGYLGLLFAMACGLYWFRYRMPRGLDVGIAVVLRNVAYQRTFKEVARARGEIERCDLSKAEQRLELFLARHGRVQPDQLDTHAVSDAHELLAQVYLRTGRPGRALKALEAMIGQTPQNYWLWLSKARTQEEISDLEGAAVSFREAFKLAPNHPEVAEEYIASLSSLNSSEEIVWVADEFRRAVRRGGPMVTVKVGPLREDLERRLLSWAGVEVEHANFDRTLELFNLPRGPRRRIPVPEEMFAPRTDAQGTLVVQLRFEGVYDGLVIDELHYTRTSGEQGSLDLSADPTSYLHRPHSGVEFYAEVRTPFGMNDLKAMEMVYSCPQSVLSQDALAIVEKAGINLKARGGP